MDKFKTGEYKCGSFRGGINKTLDIIMCKDKIIIMFLL